jgi:hypothetical protein
MISLRDRFAAEDRRMKQVRLLLVAAALCAGALGLSSALKPASVRSGIIFGDAFGTPVAIALTATGRFLVADYGDAFLFDSSNGRLKRLAFNGSGVFEPTAFAVDGDRVFIANYHGNNVLETRLDEEHGSLAVVSRIGDDATISPEGVSFDGRRLAVANYDGGNVQVFEDAAGDWKAVCRLAVPWAHGVAFNAGALFATSLGNREVLKIDVEQCRIAERVGSLGWQPGQFLWPTSVTAYGAERIAVSDAHTGLITVLRTKDLKLVTSWGGNGPGLTGLNMPYSTAVAGERLWVTSTFGRRLLAFDTTGRLTDSWALEPGWTHESPRTAFLNAQRYDGYTRTDATVLIDGSCYRPSYGAVIPCGGADRSLTIPRLINGGQLYFVQAIRASRGTFLTSPQHTTALYFEDGSAAWSTVQLGRDHWVMDSQLVGPSGPVDLAVLESRAAHTGF